MVLASSPVVSVRRFAARPVGAQSNTSIFLAWRIWRILVTLVVFPTPGPPVITVTLLPKAIATASCCEGESVRAVFCSTQVTAYSDLRTLEWRQKQARLAIDVFSNQVIFLAFQLIRLLNDRHRDFQKR